MSAKARCRQGRPWTREEGVERVESAGSWARGPAEKARRRVVQTKDRVSRRGRELVRIRARGRHHAAGVRHWNGPIPSFPREAARAGLQTEGPLVQMPER